MAVLENEMREIRDEVRGLRSLIMELLDPDAGLELTEAVKNRIRTARNSDEVFSVDDVLHELGA